MAPAISNDFPIPNAFQPTLGGCFGIAFVAKLNPSLSGSASLVYSSYLGGNNNEYGWGKAVDRAGNAYVSGGTGSTNFPTKNSFQALKKGGIHSSDRFVTKIAGN
jgi:hypothetical protein